METIQLFPYWRNTKVIRIFMGLGILLALAGVAGMVCHLLKCPFRFFGDSYWQNLIFTAQGGITIYLGWSGLRSLRYFISWDDVRITYLLPGDRRQVVIETREIETVQMKGAQVIIRCRNESENTLSLNNFYYPQRRQVREFFESLADKPNPE